MNSESSWRLSPRPRNWPRRSATSASTAWCGCNFEGRVTTAGNLAYPYSPTILDTGPVYRLNVHHLLEAEDPCMFPIKIVEVGR